jgi:prepilin-type processing-associated H-X9-DG protein
MNIWASSKLETGATIGNPPKYGQFFTASSKPAAQLILIGEKWANFVDNGLYATGSTLGSFGYSETNPLAAGNLAGRRFVGDLSITYAPPAPYGTVPTEIDWTRHRRRGEGRTYADADGRANFGFADGHVSIYRPSELADPATKKSRLVAYWSPYDPQKP